MGVTVRLLPLTDNLYFVLLMVIALSKDEPWVTLDKYIDAPTFRGVAVKDVLMALKLPVTVGENGLKYSIRLLVI